MKQFLIRYRLVLEWLALAVILLLGSYLRLYKISGYMTFLGDEGRDALVVMHMIVNHKFTLLGPTASVGGFFLGPIYYYFMLPFLWAWRLDPTGAAVMVALFGIATIYLVYVAGKAFFGIWEGLIAASLYAVSPLVIAYSRSSWNPNLVPFFSLLLLYMLWRVVVYSRPRELFWVGVILGIGIQLHYLFLFLFFVVGVWLLLWMRGKKFLPYYVVGVVGYLVGYAPFLAFEVRHGFPNTRSIIQFLLTGKDTGFVWQTFWKNIGAVTYRVVGRLLVRIPDEGVLATLPRWQSQWWHITVICLVVALVGYLVFMVVKTRSREHRTGYLLLFLWSVIVIVLFGFYRKNIYDYYFGIMFGVPFLLSGTLLAAVGKHRAGKFIATFIWIVLLWFNWQGRPFLHPPNNQLNQARTIAQAAYEKAQGQPFNFALVTDGNSDHVYRYFFEIWGNKPVTIENTIIDPERKTVTDQLIVICETVECKPLGHPLWEIAGFGPAQIVGEWTAPFVKIVKLTHISSKSP